MRRLLRRLIVWALGSQPITININRVEVQGDDPDRFVRGLAELAQRPRA